MTTIQFTDVGAQKKAWSATCPYSPADVHDVELTVLREVRRVSALMSREVDVWYNPDTGSGSIIVGGFRRVGSFVVTEAAP